MRLMIRSTYLRAAAASVALALMLLAWAAPVGAAPATPQHVPLQGSVFGPGGTTHGPAPVTVRIYADSAGGDSVYMESFPGGVLEGILDVRLGAGGDLLLDPSAVYHLELDVEGDEVIGDASGGRLPIRPGGGGHERPDLESRIAALEAALGGLRGPSPITGASADRPRSPADRRVAGPSPSVPARAARAADAAQLAFWQLGIGFAQGAASGYRLDGDMLLQPTGRFATAAHEVDLGPWLLARTLALLNAPDEPPPGRPRLEPCAPNPFNPSTTVRFGLPAAAVVRLCIYDLAGRLVRTLVDERLPAGWHRADWDGRYETGQGAVSGVYFCRLEVAGVRETRRLTLVR